MKFSRTAISSLLIIFLIQSIGFGQNTFISQDIIDSKSGFAPKNISGIIQDNKGFIWISSFNGLYKWDGISIKSFKHDTDDSLSIAGVDIGRYCMLYDSVLNKLIIGSNNDLCFFDPENEISENIAIINPSDNTNYYINSVFLDRQNKLWISTTNGIVNFNNKNGNFVFYKYKKKLDNVDINLANNIRVIRQDISNDSILWLGTLNGLIKFNKISKELRLFVFQRDLTLNTFVLITPVHDGKLYLGTWNGDMVVFNTKTQKFEYTIGPLSTDKDLYFPSNVRPFLLNSNNELWISSNEGIGYYNTEKRKIHIVKTFKNFAGRKYEFTVLAKIGKDLWTGSEYGIKRITLNNNFQNFFLPPDDNYWFFPYDLYEDTLNHKLYLSFIRGKGLNYFDLLDNSFHTIKCPGSLSKNLEVKGIKYFSEDTLLVVCSESIYKLSIRDQKLSKVRLDQQQNYNFINFEIDKKGNIWLTTKRLGLVMMNWENSTLTPVKKIIDFFKQKNIFASLGEISIDNNNRIWWTNSKYYGYYIAENDSLKVFDLGDTNFIYSFYNNDSDTVWVGTINKFLGFIDIKQPDRGLQYFFKDKTGDIFDIARDTNGIFYFLTSKGIEKWIKKDSQSIAFGKKSGLIKFDKWSNRDPTARGKLLKLSDDRFAILYRRGIGLFHPDSLNNSFEDFTPYINAIKIFNKDIHPVKSLDLKYNQNSITFEYSALALENGNDIRFSHRLSGVSKDWEFSNFHTVNYSNLSPGKYQFLVKAYNKSVLGHVKYASVDIFINPPLWASWYAYLIYLLVLVTIVYLFYRFYYKRKIAQTELIRITELEEMKSEFYTNITHEFRTPLTVILGMVEQVKSNLDLFGKKSVSDSLKMIKRNGRKLLNLVNQLLDMAKIEDGKYQIKNSKGDIVWFLGFMVENFHSFAQSKDVKLIFYPEIDKLIMDFDPKVMERIISNLLGNAIKFSENGGKVIIHLNKIEESNNASLLQIKVNDEGIGIEKSKLPYVFERYYQIDCSINRHNEGTGIGLSMVKTLVELMNGNISVESRFEKGSVFTIVLPITTVSHKLAEEFRPTEPLIVEDKNNIITSDDEDKDLVLIVEDNRDIAKYISSSISDRYAIKYAKNGEIGLKLAINTIPDIIISDVMMPVMDGLKMLEKLKQDIRTSHIPIIMLTARVAEEDKLQGLKYGADAYLTKPFNIEELNIRIEQLILLRKKLQEKYKDPVNWDKVKRCRLKSIEQEFLIRIKENINDDINNSFLNSEFLAKSMQMSNTQLYRKLKALTGKSPAIFIRYIRLQKAKELLETTDLNISEIAYDAGFNNPAYFSRAFKEEYGKPPSEVRS